MDQAADDRRCSTRTSDRKETGTVNLPATEEGALNEAEPGMHTCREPCGGQPRCGKGKERDITPNDRGMGNHAAVVFCGI